MAQINDLLTNISNIKSDIKNAIENKGQNITNFDSYANAILNIKSNGTIMEVDGNSAIVQNNTLILNPNNKVIIPDGTRLAYGSFEYVPDNYDLSQVHNGNNMFAYCPNLISIDNIDTSNMNSTHAMFDNCFNLQNVSNINLHNSITTRSLFYNCVNLTNICSLDLASSTTMTYMFYNCLNLQTINTLENLDNVVSTHEAFMYCENLRYLSNSILNMPNCINAHSMFDNCFNFTTSPEMILPNAVDIGAMFWNDHKLTNVGNITTSNKLQLINKMFVECHSLKNVPLFETSGVINTHSMFDNCWNITTVPNFNFSNVTNMQSTFYNAYNLVDVPQFYAPNLTSINKAFYNCNKLSNESIQNIINICLNSNIPSNQKNLRTGNGCSPFNTTNITNSKYSNRLTELASAGWTY